jgi:hypothetical protein
MKHLVFVFTLLLASSSTHADSFGKVHFFESWGKLPNKTYKTVFLMGFSNGFAYGLSDAPMSSSNEKRFDCLFKSGPDPEQAVAMIDKYYQDHPEQWKTSLGDAIFKALTVSGSPCQNVSR